MHILLFILYSALCGYAIRRIRFFRNSGIRSGILLLLFALRAGTGCLHDLIAWRYFPNHGDIWVFFHASIGSRHLLFTDLHHWIQDNSTWAYLPYNLIIITHILLNFLSGDNLYINTLFFSFGVFSGAVALFRAFRGLFPGRILPAATALLLPSTLFWTSCMLKDGIVFCLLGFFFYHVHNLLAGLSGRSTRIPSIPFRLPTDTPDKKRVLVLFGLLLATIFFRGNLLITLLPALLIWLVAARPGLRLPALLTVTLLLILVALVPSIHENLLRYLSDRQGEFQVLHGHSRLDLPRLTPDLAGLWQVLPYALLNGLLEPLPGSGGQAIYLVFSIELLLIWAILLWSLIYWVAARPGSPALQSPGSSPRPPLTAFGFSFCCLFFALSGMLLVGYTIPFAGTIVRYRSLYLPFLMAPPLFILGSPLVLRIDRALTRLLLRPGLTLTN